MLNRNDKPIIIDFCFPFDTFEEDKSEGTPGITRLQSGFSEEVAFPHCPETSVKHMEHMFNFSNSMYLDIDTKTWGFSGDHGLHFQGNKKSS